MSNKKHTAVEWLQSGLELIMSHEEQMQAIGLFEQAKEMHEQEIETAHTLGYIIGGGNGDLYDCKQYYKETFNTKEK
jgi:hypothetical protein